MGLHADSGLLKVGRDTTIFGEFVLPIRFQSVRPNDTFTSIGFGVHVGIAF